MEYRILGPLQACDGDRLLSLGGARQRALLAVLLLHANQVVSSDRLIDHLWGDEPPETASTALQVSISRLRRTLEPDRAPRGEAHLIQTRPPGYELRVGQDELDLHRFEQLAATGEQAFAAGDAAGAADAFREALALWSGPPLSDFTYEPFAQAHIARIEELRLTALEDRIEADLALGRHARLVGELETLVAEHPLRERPRGQLILALYRSGRQAEALDAFQDARRTLVDELGIEPSPALARLERAILVQDPSLDAPPAPAHVDVPSGEVPPPAPPAFSESRETRKVVTAVFVDIAESTALGEELDPERLRRLMLRYFDAVSAAIRRHGGTIEKFIGDAVLAVFGIPVLHEDDALRAVRAAIDVRAAVRELADELERNFGVRLRIRTGIDTGEVVASDPSEGQTFVAGNAVNVAARLQQAAAVGEILIGEKTYALVRDAARVEQLAELAVRGKSEAVRAYRLLDVVPDAPGRARRLDAPIVDRERELGLLRHAFERAVSEETCHLFTVLGTPGVGKSRLVAEFLQGLDDRATVLSGRCLPYGDGITFWPIAEILGQAADVRAEDSRLVARGKIASLIADDPDAASIAEQLAEAIGLADAQPGGPQTLWAVRRLLESLARRRPLVLQLDDIHWAEPTFLDLVEYIADVTRGCSISLICLARPELLEARSGWAGGKVNTTSILLEPLPEADCEQLVDNLVGQADLGAEARARIADLAEGNPLFVEQMLAMILEDGSPPEEITTPSSVQALLAARLDHLPPQERAVVERGAVVGKVFTRLELTALLDDAPWIDDALATLERKELVRPDRSVAPAKERYRFRHQLIRDAAYDGIPKERRGELHERYATWLEGTIGERLQELEEIIGYHLEQAYRYRTDLGPPDDAAAAIADRASRRLSSAGLRAVARHDAPAAASLLGRAVDLIPESDEERLRLLPDLARALIEEGELGRALAILDEAIATAEDRGDEGVRWRMLVERAALRFQIGAGSADELVRVGDEAIAALERLGDSSGIALAWHLVSDAHWSTCRFAKSAEALERALKHARAADDRALEAQILGGLAASLHFGPTPVPEAIERCELLLEEAQGDPGAEPTVLVTLAGLTAMRGDFESARELYGRGRSILDDLGLKLRAAWITYVAGSIELLAGDWAAAEQELRAGYAMLAAMGERDALSTQAGILGEAVYRQGRLDEAEQLTRESEELAAAEDITSQVAWRSVRAKVFAHRGLGPEAEQLAAEAVAFAEATDDLDMQAVSVQDLAEVLDVLGRSDDARAALERAIGYAERKGDLARIRRLEEQLAGRSS